MLPGGETNDRHINGPSQLRWTLSNMRMQNKWHSDLNIYNALNPRDFHRDTSVFRAYDPPFGLYLKGNLHLREPRVGLARRMSWLGQTDSRM